MDRTLIRVKGIMWGRARCLIPEWNPYETVGFPIIDFPAWVLEKLPGNAADPNVTFPNLTLFLFAKVNLEAIACRYIIFEDWEDAPEEALEVHLKVTKEAPNGNNQAGYAADKQAETKKHWLDKMTKLKSQQQGKKKEKDLVDGCNCKDCKAKKKKTLTVPECHCSYCVNENSCTYCKTGEEHTLCNGGPNDNMPKSFISAEAEESFSPVDGSLTSKMIDDMLASMKEYNK